MENKLSSSSLPHSTNLQEIHYEEPHSTEGLKTQDPTGNILVNQYRQIKTLGRGSSAKVKLLSNNDTFYAAKIFSKSFLSNKKDYIETESGELILTNALTDFYREIAIMKKIDHANIVHLKEVIFDYSADRFYLIMDFCELGPVMDWDDSLSKFYFPWCQNKPSQSELLPLFRSAAQGLDYLHYHEIAHRDIKPQNLLMTKDLNLKLADFGQSHIIYDAQMSRRALGTYQFYSPECCDEATEIDPKPCDVWALGVTFYLMLFEKMPFECDNEYRLFEVIQGFELEFPESVDSRIRELLIMMLDKNPRRRIDAEGVVRLLGGEVKRDEEIRVTSEEIRCAIVRVSGILTAVFDK